jgi:aspartyl protease family protein
MVNAVPVRFLVDTGASDVTLSRKAAERIGFDLNSIAFTRSYNTANGIVRGAPITLDNISVEGITVRNVEASINEAPLTHSLLGMSYLNRFSSYSVSRDKLTLTP